MTPDKSRSAAYWLALLIPAALLGGAYVSQYGFGLYPCEMCWWQRYPHFAAIVLAVLALVMRGGAAGPLLVRLAALAILVSGLIGGFHAGVEYGWWEGLTTCSTATKYGANALDAIMNAPVIRCDVAPWTLLGVSLAGFNFLISTAGAILVLALIGKGTRKVA
jgi:disulfide bond formation protein DsbB